VTSAALDRLLAPRSIAVVGASDRPGSFGERLSIEALRSRVDRVDLVNPRYDSVRGRTCAGSLDDLDEAPDLVLLGVPDATLPEHVAAAAARGAGGAVVFGSAAGLTTEVRGAAGDLALCGGGCMVFLNASAGVRALGYLERDDPVAGGLTVVTHSGSVFSALLRTHRRLEYDLIVSSGQELVTTTGDYLGWALEQGGTRVIGLFLETIRDATTLRSALARAASDDVPVVALTVGGSPTGRALVDAHSGAVAGSDAAWEALFAAYGVHRARDMEELVDTLELFSIGRRVRRPLRGGIATVHDSGAERVLVADVAAAEGVPFAPLSAGTYASLASRLDAGLVVGNPLDVWGRGADTETLFAGCLADLAADPAVDAVALAVDLVEEYDGDESYPRALLSVHASSDLPLAVLSTVPAAVDQVQATALRAAGIPVLEGARSGLRALRHLRDHARSAVELPSSSVERSRDPLALPAGFLDATTSLDLLARAGLRVVPTVAATTTFEAVGAADRCGFPVVLKTDEPGIAHRARVGGVVVGLPDAAAVAAAYDEMAARLGPRVVLQPQLESSAELALGMVTDPLLGPLVVLASGGGRIEELAQRVVGLPPRTPTEAAALVARFTDHVGPLDHPAAVAAAVTDFSWLVTALADQVVAVDVNPLLVTPDGLVAVDALFEN